MSCLIGCCVFCNVHVPIMVLAISAISHVTFLLLNKLLSSQRGGNYEFFAVNGLLGLPHVAKTVTRPRTSVTFGRFPV